MVEEVQEEIQIATRLEVVAQEEVLVTMVEQLLQMEKVIHRQFHRLRAVMVEVIVQLQVVLMRQQLVVEQAQ